MEVSAAVEAASTMEISSLVISAFVPTSEISSFATAAPVATTEAIIIVSAAEVAVSAIVEVVAAVIPGAPVEARAAIIATEPRSGADKHTAREVTRPVVAVRCARVRIISIVAVVAHRGWTYIGRADANADHNSLCVCVRRCDQTNPK